MFAGGELHTIAYDSRQMCSCGKFLDCCDLWRQVKIQYDADPSGPRWTELVREINRFRRPRNYVRLLTPDAGANLYVDAYRKLYSLIATVTGCEHIVDSGRSPMHALVLLRSFPNSKVVFLVRNGNAAVYSKLKRLRSGEGFKLFNKNWKAPTFYMPLFLLLGLNWGAGNVASEIIFRRHRQACIKLRYEDLCADIAQNLRLLGTFLTMDMAPVLDKVERKSEIQISHNIGGNILRFREHFIFRKVRIPLPPFKYRASFLLFAWPMMVFYGYLKRNR